MASSGQNTQGSSSGSSLQSAVSALQNLVQAINTASQMLGVTLNNVNPSSLIGNPASSDGPLQAITLADTLEFSGSSLGVNISELESLFPALLGPPIGTIFLWYSSESSIPSGYGICDGTSYTRSDGGGTITSPDLVGSFVLGATAAGATGGSTTISQANLPSYNLTVTDPGHTHTVNDPGHGHSINDPHHSHIVQEFNTGGSSAAVQFTASINLGSPGSFSQTTSASATGIAINSDTTGITNDSNTTGISVALDGSGEAYYPPYYGLIYIMKI